MIAGYAATERRAAAWERDFRVAWQRLDAPPVLRARTAAELAAEMGFSLDPWQRTALGSSRRRKLLLVSRQGGKGLVDSLAAIEKMIGDPGTKVIVLTPTEEQSKRLLARIREAYARLPQAPRVIVETAKEFHLLNGSRAYAMPGSETSVRGIDAVHLLICDEAAFIPDPLYAAVRPFLATTNGEEIDTSTPHGKRGWFYQAWVRATTPPVPPHMFAIKIAGTEIPRISPEFLANERAELGDFNYRQEYGCEWLDDETQLFASEWIAAAKSDEVKSRGLARMGAA